MSGVRNHIHNAVHLIHKTVYQLTAVFCDSQSSPLGESNTLAKSLSELLEIPLLGMLVFLIETMLFSWITTTHDILEFRSSSILFL